MPTKNSPSNRASRASSARARTSGCRSGERDRGAVTSRNYWPAGFPAGWIRTLDFFANRYAAGDPSEHGLTAPFGGTPCDQRSHEPHQLLELERLAEAAVGEGAAVE